MAVVILDGETKQSVQIGTISVFPDDTELRHATEARRGEYASDGRTAPGRSERHGSYWLNT